MSRTGWYVGHPDKLPHAGFPILINSDSARDRKEARRLIEKRIRNLSKRKLDDRGRRKLEYLKGLLK